LKRLIESQQSQLDKLQSENRTLTEQPNQYHQTVEQSRARICQLELQYDELRNQKTELEHSHKYIKDDLSVSQDENECNLGKYFALLDLHEKIRSRYNKSEEQQVELASQASVLRDKVLGARTDVKTLDHDLIELQEII